MEYKPVLYKTNKDSTYLYWIYYKLYLDIIQNY